MFGTSLAALSIKRVDAPAAAAGVPDPLRSLEARAFATRDPDTLPQTGVSRRKRAGAAPQSHDPRTARDRQLGRAGAKALKPQEEA